MKLIKEKIFPVIISALKEDIGSGDITSSLLFERDTSVVAHIIAKEECVLAGVDVAKWILDAVDERIIFTALCSDGDRLKKGKRVISIKGSGKSILSAERTVLNFFARLSGIATLTDKFVKLVTGTGAKIYDTRKTTPGLRDMEKYAVILGGGCNHRIGLWDGVLIKDNHLDSLKCEVKSERLQNIKDSVLLFKNRGYKNVEIEVENLAEFKEAVEAGADIIMLDNMKIEDIRKAVKLISRTKPRPLLEVSGRVNLENARKIAKTGVDRISVGQLTHSAPSIDFSMEICR
jgi:nicotinate-nucleotide pyrophosphorylase (carboxylating)